MGTLKISWLAVLITILAVYLLQAPVSYWEKRFLNRQRKGLTMAFVHNWAISFGDPVFFGLINGFVVPHILELVPYKYLVAILFGLGVTWAFHFSWKGHPENIGHVLDEKYKMAKAGWLHFISMTLQVAVMFLFLITPMEPDVVIIVSFLFTAFVVLQNAQAFYIQKSADKNWIKIEIALIALVTVLKLTVI